LLCMLNETSQTINALFGFALIVDFVSAFTQNTSTCTHAHMRTCTCKRECTESYRFDRIDGSMRRSTRLRNFVRDKVESLAQQASSLQGMCQAIERR
jgi:hypothetical protein